MSMSGLAQAMIESERVDALLRALGYDTLTVYRVQQEIADLHITTTLDWHEATDRVMGRILAGGQP
jgi:hypothetical protein